MEYSRPVREMEVFQPMNIGGNRVSGHRIERDDQSDLQACLSEGLGHAERGACAKGMPDQYDRGYSPALAILQCFACKGGGEGVIGDSTFVTPRSRYTFPPECSGLGGSVCPDKEGDKPITAASKPTV